MDAFRLSDQTHIANVHLRVPDTQTALDFYSKLLGFLVLDRTDNTTLLTAARNRPPIILLSEDPNAVPRPNRTTGLYHMAIRVPNRLELARVFRRLMELEYPLQGASDHLVSEAIYLADPEGNGIEIYYDRPRHQWQHEDGEVAMSTEPLDINSLLAELQSDESEVVGLDPATDMGHVHLQVSDLARSEEFYRGLLGFDVTQRGYPGAVFLAAGGYHHHIGLNTWASRGAPPPPENVVGLMSFGVAVPDEEVVREQRRRISDVGIDQEETTAGSFLVRDPDGIGVEITLHDITP